MFDTNEDKQIKGIFAHLTGWTYTSKCNDGMVYWEVKFKDGVDKSIDKELLRQRVYDLYFKPASSLGGGIVADFFGLYNIESLRRELEIADFAERR